MPGSDRCHPLGVDRLVEGEQGDDDLGYTSGERRHRRAEPAVAADNDAGVGHDVGLRPPPLHVGVGWQRFQRPGIAAGSRRHQYTDRQVGEGVERRRVQRRERSEPGGDRSEGDIDERTIRVAPRRRERPGNGIQRGVPTPPHRGSRWSRRRPSVRAQRSRRALPAQGKTGVLNIVAKARSSGSPAMTLSSANGSARIGKQRRRSRPYRSPPAPVRRRHGQQRPATRTTGASTGPDNSSQLHDSTVTGGGSSVQISCAEGSSTRSRIVTWRGRVSM
jgi:hypothetical protein